MLYTEIQRRNIDQDGEESQWNWDDSHQFLN
jgi:hypothetical protein